MLRPSVAVPQSQLLLALRSRASPPQKIYAKRAPPPSAILWENFHYRGFQHFMRKQVTLLLASALLVASVVLSFFAVYYNQKRARDQRLENTCPEEMDDMSVAEQRRFVEAPGNGDHAHCYCEDLSVLQQIRQPLCHEHVETLFTTSLVVGFTSVGTSALNLLISTLLKAMADWEVREPAAAAAARHTSVCTSHCTRTRRPPFRRTRC